MRYLILICFCAANDVLAQELPTYKIGEQMPNGLICNQGIMVCLKLYPDRTCDWGCDLDRDRSIHRSLEQREKDRAIREQEWEKLKQQGIVGPVK